MLILRLLLLNAYRHRLRTALVQLGLMMTICAFGLLRTVVDAWYAGPHAASGTRLITRSAISLVSTLPISHAQRIRAVPGVQTVSWSNWFGGVHADRSRFFAQFAIDGSTYFNLNPELRLDAEQQHDFMADRSGAVIGRRLAEQYGWKLGDTIALEGSIYPGAWQFTVRGIYHGAEPNADERQMFVHWRRVADEVRRLVPDQADQVGVFVVGIRQAADAARVSTAIDMLFRNSSTETLTETERSFKLGIVAMSETILRGIDAVSVIVILTIMVVMANTMSLTARERLAEYATLKTLGFRPSGVRWLLLCESALIALLGGALGMLLTFPVTWAFARHVPLFPVFVVSGQTLALQLVASLVVGLGAAAWPAWTLARVNIAQALRHGR
jgi:putative ABC transport system permease protein